tara:strand:+ start:222 stop:371 length:150 start_codon:yes stop_codon:yes gene_type:complete
MIIVANLSADLTVLIIAHRMPTFKECDFIVEIKNNYTIKTLKYEDICKR